MNCETLYLINSHTQVPDFQRSVVTVQEVLYSLLCFAGFQYKRDTGNPN